MNRVDSIKLKENSTIKEALEVIDKGSIMFAIVVDKDDKLIGTLTDGDIRRGILSGKGIDDTIKDVYFKKPTVATTEDSKEDIINICTTKKIYQIPIVDRDKRVLDVVLLDELLKPKQRENRVILMVGGLGTRLRPLTNSTPKPMLPVGGKPILQTIVEKFVKHGFINITMCVGYKSNIIQDYFEDGSKFGAKIDYILEDKRMGTAGALSLIEPSKRPKEPFFVMNGDLLTNVNFEKLLDFHKLENSTATMCVREYSYQVPYGVVNSKNNYITSIEEKPTYSFFVNAGIYMLNPECINLIPKNEFYDMPTLFEKLIKDNKKTTSFHLKEYWLDIGRVEEYERANKEYSEVFDA